MTGFQNLADNIQSTSDGFLGNIPDNWRQGRTAYGGLTTGLAMAAAQRAFPDLPALRSMQINFIGPVTTDPVFKPTLLRQGRNVTSVRVDGFCEDKLIASTVFVFAEARESDLKAGKDAPVADLPDDYPRFTPPQFEAAVPVFFLNFDTRLIEGSRPVTSAEKGYIRVWSRHKDENSREGIASFLTIGDVLPPAAMPMLSRFGPISSVNWQMNILQDPITDEGWWHIETKLTAAQDGYSSQIMRFWNSRGDLVAEGIQSVAIFV